MSAFIDERRADLGVERICSTLDVSASAYYQRAIGRRSARALEDERLLAVIRAAHKKNYEEYGYRRMWKHLARAGEHVPPTAREQSHRTQDQAKREYAAREARDAPRTSSHSWRWALSPTKKYLASSSSCSREVVRDPVEL